MKKFPKVTIVMPVIAINDYVLESVPKMLKLNWPNFEILIYTDKPDKKHKWPKTRIIASGKVGPAEKRDLSLKDAKGEIVAFLDDDAYPEPDWLEKMIHCFHEDKKVAAVGGPAITPEDDGLLQKVSGAIFESYVGGGKARNRYLSIGDHLQTEDWPTVNLLIRKDVFKEVGGFDNSYWPGEDTKLCLDIINAGYKIKYDPEGIVYHHRRSDLYKHLKQIGSYALHRGHFAKIYPKTSRKLFYFVPTIFDLYLISLFASWFFDSISLWFVYAIPLAIYIVLLFIDFIMISIRWKNPLVGILAVPMIFLTHFWYGVRFVQGLFIKKLER